MLHFCGFYFWNSGLNFVMQMIVIYITWLPRLRRQFEKCCRYENFVLHERFLYEDFNVVIWWNTSHELLVTSWKLKIMSWNLKVQVAGSKTRVTSSNPRVTSLNLRLQIYKLQVWIHELQVQIHEFKNHLINKNSRKKP